VDIDFLQSNHEGVLIDRIHAAGVAKCTCRTCISASPSGTTPTSRPRPQASSSDWVPRDTTRPSGPSLRK
jgi:3-dehydroquinate dehydratase